MHDDWVLRLTYTMVRVGTVLAGCVLVVAVLGLTGVIR